MTQLLNMSFSAHFLPFVPVAAVTRSCNGNPSAKRKVLKGDNLVDWMSYGIS